MMSPARVSVSSGGGGNSNRDCLSGNDDDDDKRTLVGRSVVRHGTVIRWPITVAAGAKASVTVVMANAAVNNNRTQRH